MTIDFTDRVAIVTGAGGGLGRAYALALARRGAKVVVNDLGGSRDGSGHSDAAAQVVEEIRAAGGEAMADGGSVTDTAQMQAMVERARETWGGVHILINNAGILRDKSFAKMSMDDFRAVVDVHLVGSANATHAVWETDARAGLWPDPDDRQLDRALRQFRPGQLRRGQARPRRLREDARAGGREIQCPGQHDRADRGDKDDGGHLPARAARALPARTGGSGGPVPRLGGRADQRHPRRRRRRRPGRLCHADPRRGARRADAGGGRRAISPKSPTARARSCPSPGPSRR